MNPSPDLDRYAALLEEAKQIHGTSLARDAWRRLKRNRVAIASLVFLAILSLLAFLTPVLPLQSPYNVNTQLSFATPTASPLFIDTIDIPKEVSTDATGPSDWIDKQFGKLNGFNRALVQLRAKSSAANH